MISLLLIILFYTSGVTNTVGSISRLSIDNDTIVPKIVIRDMDEFDENKIEQIYFDFIDPETNKVIKSLNAFEENPFAKTDLELIPNPERDIFFFYKVPGDGFKNQLKKYFGNKTFQIIPDSIQFEKIHCTYSSDYSTNTYLAVAYTLDLQEDYYEIVGPGYSTSKIQVYDSIGNPFFSCTLDGNIEGQPAISQDGRYLTLLNSPNPYWVECQEIHFTIRQTSDGKIVYSEYFDEPYFNSCYQGFNIASHKIAVMLLNKERGIMMFLDSKTKTLFRSKRNLEELYSFRSDIGDFVQIEFLNKKPEHHYFNQDFDIIKL